MFEYLFKEYTSYSQRVTDSHVIFLHILGGAFIAITFAIIGILCIVTGDLDQKSKKRSRLAKMFGLFLISCATSRTVDLIAIWHNYAVIAGYVKILTGLLATITLFAIPSAIREIRMLPTIKEVDDKLQETKDKMDKVQEISDKLNKE